MNNNFNDEINKKIETLYIENESKENNISSIISNKIKIGFEFDFKIAIFDLDQTLWNEEELYENTINILRTFYRYSIKMYIVSFNLLANECCEWLGITYYFDKIYFTREKTKLQIIQEILNENEDVNENEVIFFDDLLNNITEVNDGSNVQTIHIKNGGIDWTYIPIKYKYRIYNCR
jgi:FMN phosphatase YigB (HAD superfamily)